MSSSHQSLTIQSRAVNLLVSVDATRGRGREVLEGSAKGCGFFVYMKTILTTPTPHISKKYAPKICHKMRGHVA